MLQAVSASPGSCDASWSSLGDEDVVIGYDAAEDESDDGDMGCDLFDCQDMESCLEQAAAAPSPSPSADRRKSSRSQKESEESAPASSSASSSPLDVLMECQTASGLFRWDAGLQAVLGLRSKASAAKKLGDAAVEEEVWVTAVVLAFLAKRMAGQAHLWELLAVKARRSLEQRLPEKKKREKMMRLAETVV